jgi:hypothetical protein
MSISRAADQLRLPGPVGIEEMTVETVGGRRILYDVQAAVVLWIAASQTLRQASISARASLERRVPDTGFSELPRLLEQSLHSYADVQPHPTPQVRRA